MLCPVIRVRVRWLELIAKTLLIKTTLMLLVVVVIITTTTIIVIIDPTFVYII